MLGEEDGDERQKEEQVGDVPLHGPAAWCRLGISLGCLGSAH